MADIYVFMGPPGAGKGSMGELFCGETGVVHVSTGDLLRAEMAAGSELGTQVKELIAKGQLVSDDIVAAMVEKRLAQKDIREHGCLLDGFPRTVPQAEVLDGILSKLGHRMAAVLLIEADEEMLVKRMTSRRMCSNKDCGAIYNILSLPPKQEGICDRCGQKLYQRADDSEETARNRMTVYQKQTAPLIDFYSRKGQLVRTVSDDSGIDACYQRLRGVLHMA